MAVENFGLVIHGGAGTMARDKMTPEVECAHRVDHWVQMKETFESAESLVPTIWSVFSVVGPRGATSSL